MTILNKSSKLVSAAMTDAFSADAPTTQTGLEKEPDQTGIFIFSKADYNLYLKNAAGAWVEYGSISGARESITVPWGDNTAAFFKCADANAEMHVYRQTGNILYDSTPENAADDQNTLLTSAGSAAQAAQNYTFPEADGTAGQILKTDGFGQLSWSLEETEVILPFTDHIIPDTNAAYDLGSADYKVRHLFLSDNSIKFESGDLGVVNNKLTFNGETVGSGGGASTKVQVLTSDITLDSSHNGGVIIVEDFALINTIKLPAFSTVGTGYQVKLIVAKNNQTGQMIIQSSAMNEMMTGLISRFTYTDGSGWDQSPNSFTWNATGPAAADNEENTLTLSKTLSGTEIEFSSDGNRWYVFGQAVSLDVAGGADSHTPFTKETF